MKRVLAFLLAACMAILPTVSIVAEDEEIEVFISESELILGRDDASEGDSDLDNLNNANASIVEQLGKKDWTALAAEAKKKGDWREDIVSVAQTQVGFAQEKNGMTIYTAWAEYEEAQDWTTLFVNWVAVQAGLTEKQFPHMDTYQAFTQRMKKLGALKDITRASYPMSGDLALIEKDGQQLVGVVVYVSNGVASVIIGDDNGAVTLDLYSVNKNGFTQYVDLDVLMIRAGIEVGKGGKVPVIPEGGVAAWTNTNAVYMRSEPTTASQRVTTVKKPGTALLVVSAEMQGDGYIWYGVEYGKYEGYIRGDLLDLDMAAVSFPADAPETTPVVTPAPTVVPGCAVCMSVANGVALPVDCCYEHLVALGTEYANQFMLALMEADPLTRQLYVDCHDAHVAAGAEAMIPLGGLGLVERVVNIEVKKALVGEAVTIGFEIYGATKYQWHQVMSKLDENDQVVVEDTAIDGATDCELTVYAKPGTEISYYCVAELPLGYAANGEAITVTMTSKVTTIAGGEPIVVVAILGEEVNFTYEYVGAVSYQWYVSTPVKFQTSNNVGMKAARLVTALDAGTKLTLIADGEYSVANDAYFYCEALDGDGNVLSTSNGFAYSVDVTDLCKYVDELVGMTRSERYDIMTGLWASVDTQGKKLDANSTATTLADAVKAHWQADHKGEYSKLLCTCEEMSNTTHDSECGWYVKSAADNSGVKYSVTHVTATLGAKFPFSSSVNQDVIGDRFELYYDDVLVMVNDNNFVYLMADETERVYQYVIYRNGVKVAEETLVVTAYELTADRVKFGHDTILDAYLAVIADNYAEIMNYMPTGVYDRAPIYELMTSSWNKWVMDYATGEKVNLAKEILLYWNDIKLSYEEDMFCICCITDDVISDKIMLHPDAIHTNPLCGWYEDPFSPDNTATNPETGVTVNGILPEGIVLTATAKTPDRDLLALMQQGEIDEMERLSLKAYDITPYNADGTVWQPAKGTTVKVTIPSVYTYGDNVTVNVYHLLVDESEIAPGYGYEKLSSDHYGGVTLNSDGSITFETDGFSTFYVETATSNEACLICGGTAQCAYMYVISAGRNSDPFHFTTSAQERYQYLCTEQGNHNLEYILENYYKHVQAGALDVLCSSMPLDVTGIDITKYDPQEHSTYCNDPLCPWNENVNVKYYTGEQLLVGDTVTLESDVPGGDWYRADNGEKLDSNVVEATAQKVTYLYKVGDEVVSTHVVAAQTSILYFYTYRLYDSSYHYNTGKYDGKGYLIYDKDAVYQMMTGKWNVMADANQRVTPMNLAQSILAYWDQAKYYEDGTMFCTCCYTCNGMVDGKMSYTFDGIMRHPDDVHKAGCPWAGDHNVSTTPDVSNPDALKDMILGTTQITLSTTLNGNSYVWQQGTINVDGSITWEAVSTSNAASCTVTLTGEALTHVYRCVVTDASGNTVESTVTYIGGVEFATWASNAEEVATWLANSTDITMADVLLAHEKHQHGIPLNEVILMVGNDLYTLMDHVLLAEGAADETGMIVLTDVRYHIAVATYDPNTKVITALN